MDALTGPFHVLALVLVVSGLQKLVSPVPAADALVSAGLPIPRRRRALAGRVLGAGETAVGFAALGVPHPATAALLATAYAGLAAFVVWLRRVDADAGCGCFGAASAPPGTAHLVLNLAGVLVAATVAASTVPDVVDVFDEGIGVAVPYVALLGIGATLVLLAPAHLAAGVPTAGTTGVRR